MAVEPEQVELEAHESLTDRISGYLPPPEILEAYREPRILDLERLCRYSRERPGCELAMVLYKGKLVFVPVHHPLNTIPGSSNSQFYGTACIGTLTLEPVVDRTIKDRLVGGNAILLEERVRRLFQKSLPDRGINLGLSQAEFTRALVDFISVSAPGVLVPNEAAIFRRGSVRIVIGHGLEKPGKSTIGNDTTLSVEVSFDSPAFTETLYKQGIVVAAGPNQRHTEFKGKQASKYGDAGRIGEAARKLGADDSILFAPFLAEDQETWIHLSEFRDNPQDLKIAMLNLALSDGIGAELLAVTKEGILLLPPMTVNRLGGTTAKYVAIIAEKLGVQIDEAPFSLRQVINKEIISLFFAGNAARITPIAKIILYDFEENILHTLDLGISDIIQQISNRYEMEVAGILPPSDPGLTTFIDIEAGIKARELLAKTYSSWFSLR